jgi:hypothetical protein
MEAKVPTVVLIDAVGTIDTHSTKASPGSSVSVKDTPVVIPTGTLNTTS